MRIHVHNVYIYIYTHIIGTNHVAACRESDVDSAELLGPGMLEVWNLGPDPKPTDLDACTYFKE